jgi:acetolactate decarboxylase
LHPAEFSEICGAKDLSGFMKFSDLLKTEKCGAKNRCALFLHSGFMKYVQKTASLYFCTPDFMSRKKPRLGNERIGMEQISSGCKFQHSTTKEKDGMSKRFARCLILCIIVFGFYGCATEKLVRQQGTLTQISTLDALVSGIYDGQMSLQDVKQYGDTGIGTFQGLDGEMLMMDGTIYKIASDGSVSVPEAKTLTPYAAVTFFEANREIVLAPDLTMSGFAQAVDPKLPTGNLFYAFRIEGTFKKMKTRSVPKQEKPYQPLTEVVKKQSVFEFENTEGVIIGLRCPSYVKGLNAPGYHLHFLSKDKKAGGHVLDFTAQKAVLKLAVISKFAMIIPESQDFYQHDFTKDNLDIKQVIQPKQ